MKLKILHGLGILLFFGPLFGPQDPRGMHSGTVLKIIDGDTVIMEIGGARVKIRLAYIDAPELKQTSFSRSPMGKISRDHLMKLLKNAHETAAYLINKDMYGRWLGEIYSGNKNLNLDMVRSGMAMVYPRIDQGTKRNKAIYQGQELIARLQKRGLWNDKGFNYPWEYRRLLRRQKKGRLN